MLRGERAMAGGKDRRRRNNHQNVRSASKPYYQSGISFHKSKGQHILINPQRLDSMVTKSGIKSTDIILEIGPGTGNLTKRLLEAGKRVIAIEKDPRMILELEKRFQGTQLAHKLTVITADVLKCDLPYFDICVSNIPYQISSRLIFKLLSHPKPFRCAVLMFQEEFAMTLCAKPGEEQYSRLSVNTQLLAAVDILMPVGRNDFRPPPKVDSRVVRIERRKQNSINIKEWDGFTRICFIRKSKTLGAIFRPKSVVNLLEKNYNTLVALQSSQQQSSMDIDMVSDSGLFDNGNVEGCSSDDDDDDNDEEMEAENGDASKCRSGFKDKVVSVLKEGDFEDKRASKLFKQEFINLLALFNKVGIHFA